MAATDYTSQGFGTYKWADPEAPSSSMWDGNTPWYGGPDHGYVQHSPFAYDPVSGRWLWAHNPDGGTDDHICYIYYSNVTDDLASVTSWTQCTTNIPSTNTNDIMLSFGMTYDEDNARFHAVYLIQDTSVSQYESRSAMFTFSGSDITRIYYDAQTWGDTDRDEAALYRTMDLVNETDTTPTPAADDGRAIRLVNLTSGSQGVYTSYIDRSVPDETWTVGNGPNASSGDYTTLLSEHDGDIRRWYDYADMYNTTQNDMMLHQLENNVAKAYQMRWEGGVQNEVYTTAGTGTTAVSPANMTYSTQITHAAAWYDNTTAKFYSFGVGNQQFTGGVETAMKTSTDYGATWSADLANGQDAGDLIEAWNPTDNSPVSYLLFARGKNGKAYICVRDTHTDSTNQNYAAIVLEYDCVNDTWSEYARLKPPSGQGANSEKVIGAWIDDTNSYIIVGVYKPPDSNVYFYVKALDYAVGGAPSAWGVWGT